MKLKHLPLVSFVAVSILSGCQEDSIVDNPQSEPNALDVELEAALTSASDGEGISYYKLPTSLSEIPQDPRNPLTAA